MSRTKFLIAFYSCFFSISAPAQSIDVFETGIRDLQSALEDETTTSVELVDLYLARIAAYD